MNILRPLFIFTMIVPIFLVGQSNTWKNDMVHKAEQHMTLLQEDSAFYYLIKAEEIYKSEANDSALAIINQRLAIWHRRQNQIDKAIYRIDLALQYFQEKDTARWAHYLHTKASIYLTQSNYSEAAGWMEKSEELNTYLNDSLLITLNYLQHFHLNKQQGFEKKAFSALKKALGMSLLFDGAKKHFSWLSQEIASYYLKQNQPDSSLHMYKMALRTVKKSHSKMNYLVHRGLGEAYNATGQLDSAFYHYKKYVSLYEEWIGGQRQELAMKLESEYENKLKTAQIEKLQLSEAAQKKGKQILFISTSALLLLLILGAYAFLQYRRNQEKAKLILAQESESIIQEGQVRNLKSMIVGQETERKRFARELHDALGGSALMVKLAAQKFPKDISNTNHYKDLINAADENIQLIRDISKDLMPAALEKYGLKIALQEYIDRLKNLSNIRIFHDFIGDFENKNMSDQNELNLYRCIQEILSNVIKHAEATEVQMTILKNSKSITITIEDDGKGFKMSEEIKNQGLQNLEMRCEFIGAGWHVDSAIDRGTTWVINLPLNA